MATKKTVYAQFTARLVEVAMRCRLSNEEIADFQAMADAPLADQPEVIFVALDRLAQALGQANMAAFYRQKGFVPEAGASESKKKEQVRKLVREAATALHLVEEILNDREAGVKLPEVPALPDAFPDVPTCAAEVTRLHGEMERLAQERLLLLAANHEAAQEITALKAEKETQATELEELRREKARLEEICRQLNVELEGFQALGLRFDPSAQQVSAMELDRLITREGEELRNLRERIAALNTEIETLKKGPNMADPITQADVDRTVTTAIGALRTEVSGQIAALEGRLAAVEKEQKALRGDCDKLSKDVGALPTLAQATVDPFLTGVLGRISALEGRPNPATPPVVQPRGVSRGWWAALITGVLAVMLLLVGGLAIGGAMLFYNMNASANSVGVPNDRDIDWNWNEE